MDLSVSFLHILHILLDGETKSDPVHRAQYGSDDPNSVDWIFLVRGVFVGVEWLWRVKKTDLIDRIRTIKMRGAAMLSAFCHDRI